MPGNRSENSVPENGTKTVRKKRKSSKRLIIPVYLLIVAILIFVVYAYPTISGALKRTMTVEYGELKVTENVTCYIVKDETLYFANAEGQIDYLYDEGTLVRGGSDVLTISPASVSEDTALGSFGEHASVFASGGTLLDTSSSLFSGVLGSLQTEYTAAEEAEETAEQEELQRYISRLETLEQKGEDGGSGILSDLGVIPENYSIPEPGIISYQLDGYESELNPHTMTLLDRSRLEQIETSSEDVSRERTRYGEPLFKIVNNTAWYAIIWINEEDLGKYSEGNSITLRLPDGDADGKVERVSENDGDIMVVLKFDTYYDNIASLRKVQTEVVTSDYSGLMIRNSFIASEDGTAGVYVLDVTGDSKFVPVKVKATDGEYSLVESGYYYEYDETTGESQRVDTVEPYDEIERP